ncbi:MAG: putative transposase [Alphaproteobacteria bacterium]|jgi:putative transposase
MKNPLPYFNGSPEIMRLAVMMVVRYSLSLRQVEDLLFECGVDIGHETLRFCRTGSAQCSLRINRRETFKKKRSAALAKWRQLAA